MSSRREHKCRYRVPVRWLAVLAVMSLTAVACSPTNSVATSTSTGPVTTTTTQVTSDEICLSGDLPFAGDGLIAALGDDVGDATAVSQLRWLPSSNCERVTIVFGSVSGAPASTLGPSDVTVISFAGIIRATLPQEVDVSAIADTIVEGSLVQSIYVVRDADGTMFVDIHAVDEIPLEARAFTTTSPATLIIDIVRADTAAVPLGVTVSPSVIVLSPIPGTSTYPIVVDSYVEPGLLAARVQLVVADEVVVDTSVSVPGWTDTWQSLSTVIEDGPSGTAVLFIGTLDPNGQQLEGARVSITMEQP